MHSTLPAISHQPARPPISSMLVMENMTTNSLPLAARPNCSIPP
jgi:hypothetical protein